MNKFILTTLAIISFNAMAQTTGRDSTGITQTAISNAIATIPTQTQQAVSFASLGIATTADLQAIQGSQCPNCTCPNGTANVISGYKYAGTGATTQPPASYGIGALSYGNYAGTFDYYTPIYKTVCL